MIIVLTLTVDLNNACPSERHAGNITVWSYPRFPAITRRAVHIVH